MTTMLTAEMSVDEALLVLRRKPVGQAEHGVARAALLLLRGIGMGQASIEREAMRTLSYSEELVLVEF
ncbi:MAG: hypothetical protein P4L67_04470 [Candidatus Pacebacteria bacterium]|nr:hypothetical protein [Candidatus Paceibacterota bacterium]